MNPSTLRKDGKSETAAKKILDDLEFADWKALIGPLDSYLKALLAASGYKVLQHLGLDADSDPDTFDQVDGAAAGIANYDRVSGAPTANTVAFSVR